MRWPEEYIMACAVAVLIFALVTEFFFRMINRFSKESKAFFRWVYIIGLALVILVGTWRAKDVINADMTQSPMGVMFGLIVAVAGLITLVLMLMKDEK